MSSKERVPNDPKRQHYVPEAYLKAWIDPAMGQLWRCQRSPIGKLHDKTVAPRGTGFVRDLYTFSSATPLIPVADPYFIERKFFRKVDNDGAAALAILRGPGIDGLDAAGRRAWAVYLNALIQRQPDVLSRMDAVAKARADRTFEHLQAGSDAKGRERFARLLSDEARAGLGRNFVRQHMMERIEDEGALGRIEQQRWVLVNNTNPEVEFITSDSPVVLNGGSGESGLQTLAIALSPQRLFVVHPHEWFGNVDGRKKLGLLAFAHNLLLLEGPCQYVYSRSKLQDGDFIKLRRAVDLQLGRGDSPEESG